MEWSGGLGASIAPKLNGTRPWSDGSGVSGGVRQRIYFSGSLAPAQKFRLDQASAQATQEVFALGFRLRENLGLVGIFDRDFLQE